MVKSQRQAVKPLYNPHTKKQENKATDHHPRKDTNIAEPAIHLKNVQHMERHEGDVASWIT